MRFTNTQLAILSLIIANIIWGAAAPIYKWTLQEIDPFTFSFLRFLISAIVILPFTINNLKIKRHDLYTLVFMSVIGLAFRIAYNMYGLKFAPSINELIIASTAPVFLIIGAVMLFHEKTRKKLLLGMSLSFVGVSVIIIQPIWQQGLDLSFMGNIFFIVAMCLGVVYILLLKYLAPRYNLLTILFWSFTIAAATLLPFASYEAATSDVLNNLTMKSVLGITFAVFFSTILGHLLHIYGVKYIKASEVGLFTYVDPFIGIAIAQPLLGEQMTSYYIFGAFLVFLGIFIAENRIHYHPIHLLNPQQAPEQIPVHQRDMHHNS